MKENNNIERNTNFDFKLPKSFKSTEDAEEFGKNATQKQIEVLKTRREQLLIEFQEEMKKSRNQKAANIATQAQFCREAFEAYEKKLKSIK
ncbi:hypothetical protein A3B84_00510 [Candidatus Nomurabacteria bacterium RIFCSPHIGHO2_02_FULL_35_13]|uniref:Uncharacterized protein n=2 Tax=Candidatus Nomuraibacteriota TaxID=1752729 RepID=A0A1F6VNY0_9BACT|nr:MAG: hypothetical protein UR88_C0011G0004 [Candidatus Nomurabacteria bacterium GW2011_GWA1_35_8]OGI71334.1 MAG: hypothetical protein A3B84_00510 [Candidatus Nomurabacteria bacterium RIFCSPHIGHO2_02_FULL_35_13]